MLTPAAPLLAALATPSSVPRIVLPLRFMLGSRSFVLDFIPVVILVFCAIETAILFDFIRVIRGNAHGAFSSTRPLSPPTEDLPHTRRRDPPEPGECQEKHDGACGKSNSQNDDECSPDLRTQSMSAGPVHMCNMSCHARQWRWHSLWRRRISRRCHTRIRNKCPVERLRSVTNR